MHSSALSDDTRRSRNKAARSRLMTNLRTLCSGVVGGYRPVARTREPWHLEAWPSIRDGAVESAGHSTKETALRRSLWQLSLRCRHLIFKRVCGFSDHVEHEFGLGQHRNVAAVSFVGLRSHTLCDETLQVGLDGMVIGSNDVPARSRLPRCAFALLIEQVCRRRRMRCPN